MPAKTLSLWLLNSSLLSGFTSPLQAQDNSSLFIPPPPPYSSPIPQQNLLPGQNLSPGYPSPPLSPLPGPPPGPPPINFPFSAPESSGMENNSFEKDRISEILDFWFGVLPGADFFPHNKLDVWFARTPEIDRQMRNEYAQDLINVERGEYNYWRETPRGRLALILLLDQFPRHLYRNKPQSFVFDRMAKAIVLEGMQKGDDRELYPIERAFFYLPLEHSEEIYLQNLSINAYKQLLMESPEPIRLHMQDFYYSALLHHQQISRFGRFPHRNVILGRESTPEETVFLMQWQRH